MSALVVVGGVLMGIGTLQLVSWIRRIYLKIRNRLFPLRTGRRSRSNEKAQARVTERQLRRTPDQHQRLMERNAREFKRLAGIPEAPPSLVSAMENLGYKKKEATLHAQRAAQHAPNGTLQDQIRLALDSAHGRLGD